MMTVGYIDISYGESQHAQVAKFYYLLNYIILLTILLLLTLHITFSCFFISHGCQ